MGTADEIGKLHALVKEGALTQAEFEAAKTELFRRQSAGGVGDPLKAAAEGANRMRLSDSDKWIAGGTTRPWPSRTRPGSAPRP